jgi:hypothetical protein
LFTPGESDAAGYDGFLTNETIVGRFAEEIGGAVILLEREFFDQQWDYKLSQSAHLVRRSLLGSLITIPQFDR